MSGDPHAAGAAADSGRRPWLAFFGCSLIWGSTFLFISIGNDSLPPVWAAALRVGLAALLLSAITKLARHPFPRGAALRAAAMYGVFQFGFNMPLLYWGEKTVPSGLTAVMFATIPLSAAMITRVLGMEALQPLKIAGALVALAGVAVIGGLGASHHLHVPGVIAVIASATCGALGTTLLKRGPRQSPWGANAVGNLVGLPFCLAGSALTGERWILPHSTSGWVSVTYLVVAGSAGAFALMAWLIHRWPVTRVAFISVVVPIIAMLLGAVVRHEALTPRSMVGAALVLAGLACGMAADRLASHRAKAAAAAAAGR